MLNISNTLGNPKDGVSNTVPIISVPIEKDELPAVIHGEVLTDRKSSFQGHVARVHSAHQVKYVRGLSVN